MKLWPKQLTCEHCDGDRGDSSIADCESCGTTTCDLCFEDNHAYGPCNTLPEDTKRRLRVAAKRVLEQQNNRNYDPLDDYNYPPVASVTLLITDIKALSKL
jgi:hypothetical protein